jgi:hypothetical protein
MLRPYGHNGHNGHNDHNDIDDADIGTIANDDVVGAKHLRPWIAARSSDGACLIDGGKCFALRGLMMPTSPPAPTPTWAGRSICARGRAWFDP